MYLVTIEDKAYKLTTLQFRKLINAIDIIINKPFYNGQDVDQMEAIEGMIYKWRCLGPIQFDFRL